MEFVGAWMDMPNWDILVTRSYWISMWTAESNTGVDDPIYTL